MRREDWMLAGLLGSVHFTFHFFMRIVPPLIPVLAIELALPLWQLGFLVTMYFAGAAVGLLPAGHLSDHYDRRITLTAGFVLVSSGYLVFAFSTPIGAVIPALPLPTGTVVGTSVAMNAGMFVAGMGTSVHVPVGVPILTANVSDENEGKVMGIWTGMSSLGDAASPALIGILILAFAWREIVLAFALLGFVYTAVLFRVLSDDRFETVPVGEGDDGDGDGADDEEWLTDRRAYLYPMLVLVIYFAGYMIAVQGVTTFTPLFIAEIYAYSFDVAGAHFGPESFADFALSALLVAASVARFVGGVAVDWTDHKKVLFGSLSIAAGALFVLTFVPLGPVGLLGVLVVFGGSLWGNTPARNTLVSELAPSRREGRTFSYLWAASRVFGALSPAFVGFIADTAGIRQGFEYLIVAIGISALAIGLLFSNRVYVPAGDRSGQTT